MTEPTQPNIPVLPPPPAVGLAVIRNLEAKLAAAPSAQLLAKVPWDGPRLDPDILGTRAMLAWLR